MKTIGSEIPVPSGNTVESVANHRRGVYSYTVYSDGITVVHVGSNANTIARWRGEQEWYIGEFTTADKFTVKDGPYTKLAAALVAYKLGDFV